MQRIAFLAACWAWIVCAASCAAADAKPAEPGVAFGTIVEGGLISCVDEGRRNGCGLAWYYGDLSTNRVMSLRSLMLTEADTLSSLRGRALVWVPVGEEPYTWRIQGNFFWAAYVYSPGGGLSMSPILRMGFPMMRVAKAEATGEVRPIELIDPNTFGPNNAKHWGSLQEGRFTQCPAGNGRSPTPELQTVSRSDFGQLLNRVGFTSGGSGGLFAFDFVPVTAHRLNVYLFVHDKMEFWQYDFRPVEWKPGTEGFALPGTHEGWLGEWTRQASFAVGFREPFRVAEIPNGIALVTDSGKCFVAEKGPDDQWTAHAVWQDESRPLIAMVDVPDQKKCYAFGKDFYFLLTSKPEPVECREVTLHRTDHGEPLRTVWECAKVLHENGPLAVLDSRFSRLETLSTTRPEDYYREAAGITNGIVDAPATLERNSLARRLLTSLLAKERRPPEVRADDLFVMQKLARCLLSMSDLPLEEHRRNAQVLCRFLGELRKEMVPDFQWRKVTENVAPPPGVPGFSGMSPKSVRDPVARGRYEAAIRENQENAAFNSRQSVLPRIDLQMSAAIVSYVAAAFRGQEASSKLLAECVKNARLSDVEQKELMTKIRSGRTSWGDGSGKG